MNTYSLSGDMEDISTNAPLVMQKDKKIIDNLFYILAIELLHAGQAMSLRLSLIHILVERMNSDLANILGNLVNRTISMSNKYFGGEVADKGAAGEADADLKATVLEAVKRVDEKMDKLRVADAITEIFGIFRRSNKYIDETMPWTLAKDEAQKDRLATVLYNLTERCV